MYLLFLLLAVRLSFILIASACLWMKPLTMDAVVSLPIDNVCRYREGKDEIACHYETFADFKVL